MFLKESTNIVFTEQCKELLSHSEIGYTKEPIRLNERLSIHNSTQKSITARPTSPEW